MQTSTPSKKKNALLWTLQALLALLFLFAGGTKLILPMAALTAQSPLPGAFLRFIGVAEVLGALGLVLPGMLRIQQVLTPLAAGGLAVIMIGATILCASEGPAALFPFVVGVACAYVAHGRRPAAPPAAAALPAAETP
ncbi:putative integral membrane protein [Minicystis rosea]|nr:putative integral membrane protein [Minicystis rosea]